jgi:hypothetical protein
MRAGADPLMMQHRRRCVQERKIDNRHFGSQARASDIISPTDTAEPIVSAVLYTSYLGDRYLETVPGFSAQNLTNNAFQNEYSSSGTDNNIKIAFKNKLRFNYILKILPRFYYKKLKLCLLHPVEAYRLVRRRGTDIF